MGERLTALARAAAGALAAASFCVMVSGSAVGQSAEDTPPARPVTGDTERLFLDTEVFNVFVDERLTVAEMTQAPDSPCAEEEGFYIYARDRAKWLYQTGRLMQARREGATIRISFRCIEGLQSINAIQFLSPPPSRMARDMPQRDRMSRQQPAPDAMRTSQAQAARIPRPTQAQAYFDRSTRTFSGVN